MSINDFMDKIKGKIGLDVYTLICLCIIVIVSVASFGLGRLSVLNTIDKSNSKLGNDNTSLVKGEIGNSNIVENDTVVDSSLSKKRMYVASKNGKLYYSLGCSGAKRISAKNEIWFATTSEAEKAGFTLSASCK
ncbi:MAG: hypothetical protein WCI91_01120 [Candidatus Nomurabacteria bacterium]